MEFKKGRDYPIEAQTSLVSGQFTEEVTITAKRYRELVEAEMVLNSLYGAGIDNWEGWSLVANLLEEQERLKAIKGD